MKQNPCRFCALSKIDFNGKHCPGYAFECGHCENIKKHKKYLHEHRKYEAGEPITNLETLLEQEWVMWDSRTIHIEAVKNLQMRTIMNGLNNNSFYKAIKKRKRGLNYGR